MMPAHDPNAAGGRDRQSRCRIAGKAPAMNCPACGARASARSSDEITPTFRRLYYRCSDDVCGMTWTASLSFEHVLSPSGVSKEFRPAKPAPVRTKPPGHDFGQRNIFELIPKKPPD